MTLDPMSISPDFQGWAVEFLDARLAPNMRAFEWGSGWSTVWLGARCGSVVSVEHDAEWHAVTARRLVEYGLVNVQLLHVPKGAAYEDYAARILDWPDEHFHVVSVDGRNRAACIGNALAKLARPGGMLVVDNYPRLQYQEALRPLMGEWDGKNHKGGWTHVLFYAGYDMRATGVWFRPKEG